MCSGSPSNVHQLTYLKLYDVRATSEGRKRVVVARSTQECDCGFDGERFIGMDAERYIVREGKELASQAPYCNALARAD